MDINVVRPPSDVNDDGKVEIYDLILVTSNFGKMNFDEKLDLNKDKVIDIYDLVLIGSAIK